ncbi:MAG: glutamine--tRNA ligase/YqeY domain fusion protein [Deltaproteobacteria bacterium]|jgi:glutaminyl-tRNA synthetase|nr:glutamine--tRNA ligase/YqeY domain fusion protein [Deltaproteobacteria bacterium]
MNEPKGKTEGQENAPNFVHDLVREDLRTSKHGGAVVTRFPPEPNGYLHIGHAKSICLNFTTAELAEGGRCHLRFDDTNPEAEDTEYVESIREDVRWLGFDWGSHEYFASDYFERLYQCAVDLIERGLAYVDSQSLEEIRKGRGDFYTPGVNSPFRDRSVDENLDLFARMRAGELDEGSHVLRAKIDMASKDVNLRDPLMYRIRKVTHHRTGDDWCIYPMYDYAHPMSDAFEGITHSICTLEFAHHNPLYQWFVSHFDFDPVPWQYEFARLNLTYTVMSKRLLKRLVEEGHVDGWDDPRMPTIAGMRRRGYTPAAVRRFAERIGVSRRDSIVDVGLLEHALREDLNATSPRTMAVLRPLKVVIENFPADEEVTVDAPFSPDDPSFGSRTLHLTREIFIERDDFMEEPAKKWFRLAPGKEVRLRYGALITCTDVIKDDSGEVVELRCTWDPDSKGGNAPDGRRVRGTIHWVSAKHAVDAEVRLYDRLFNEENPLDESHEGDFTDRINPSSLEVVQNAKLEPNLATRSHGERVQFERLGYFIVDPDSTDERPVYDRTIQLKDSWAKKARN